MKKLLFCALMGMGMLGASANGTMDVSGVIYNVDTLFHATIGPGTTQTSLYLTSGNKHMRVFYTTTDITDPYVKVHAVSGNDMMAGGETVRSMAVRKTKPGEVYFAGVNGDFWFTGGSTTRGQSMVGAPIGASIANGVVYKANNWSETQYVIDENGAPMIGAVSYNGTLKNAAGETASIVGINSGTVDNMVTLYNPKYFKGTNETGVTEVQVKFVDGDAAFKFGQTCKVTVVNTPSSAGDMDVPSEGLVLSGKGTAATYIGALKPGDELDLTFNAVMNGQSIVPNEVISGNPWVLKDGVVQNGDASVHPRTVLGYSEDGKKVVFLVVDGRSPLSDGATTGALGCMMKYAGCHMALNVDGGGSTTLYTSMLGIRNIPSDGSERADSNGIFLVCEAPEDNTVRKIDFVDYKIEVPKYGYYAPKVNGYNKYGLLIKPDFEDVKIGCDDSIGHVENGVFYADGTASEGYIKTWYPNGCYAQRKVRILDSSENIYFKNDTIINDGIRSYTVEVNCTVGEKEMAISPSAFTWSSSDEKIVTIDATTGKLIGKANGEALIVGKLGEMTDTMVVKVEIPEYDWVPLNSFPDMSNWNISQSGGKDVEIIPFCSGVLYTYTGASSRSPKITLSKPLRLWSMPQGMGIGTESDGSGISSVVVGFRMNGESMTYKTLEMVVPTDGSGCCLYSLNFDELMDFNLDVSKYPITINSIQFNMNPSTTGTRYDIYFPNMFVWYAGGTPAPQYNKYDLNHDGVVNVGDLNCVLTVINWNLSDNNYGYMGTKYFHDTDVNSDWMMNAADIATMVNAILTNETNNK